MPGDPAIAHVQIAWMACLCRCWLCLKNCPAIASRRFVQRDDYADILRVICVYGYVLKNKMNHTKKDPIINHVRLHSKKTGQTDSRQTDSKREERERRRTTTTNIIPVALESVSLKSWLWPDPWFRTTWREVMRAQPSDHRSLLFAPSMPEKRISNMH